jgi:hypothetical protein
MPWFPVDDSFHSHPKVLATSPAALGLWVVAGSWSNSHLTDGRVPDHVLPLLLPDAEKLAEELVARRLWRRTRGGYVFHDWLEWGSKRTAAEVRDLRAKRAVAGRKGGLASGKTRSKRRSKPEASASRLVEPTPFQGSPLTPRTAGGTAGCARHSRPRAGCADCQTRQHRPAWCGNCDERTRLTGEPPTRCPACHPLAGAATNGQVPQDTPQEVSP